MKVNKEILKIPFRGYKVSVTQQLVLQIYCRAQCSRQYCIIYIKSSKRLDLLCFYQQKVTKIKNKDHERKLLEDMDMFMAQIVTALCVCM